MGKRANQGLIFSTHFRRELREQLAHRKRSKSVSSSSERAVLDSERRPRNKNKAPNGAEGRQTGARPKSRPRHTHPATEPRHISPPYYLPSEVVAPAEFPWDTLVAAATAAVTAETSSKPPELPAKKRQAKTRAKSRERITSMQSQKQAPLPPPKKQQPHDTTR